MLAGALREVYQFPALLQVHGAGYLDSHMLAVLQRTLGHGEMVVPVGGNINQVDISPLTQRLVSRGAAVYLGRRQPCIAKILLAPLGTALLIITERHNLHTGNVREAAHSTRTAHAQSHKTDSHGGKPRRGEAHHMLLPRRACRSVHDNRTAVPMPLGAGTLTLGQHCGRRTQHGRHHRCPYSTQQRAASKIHQCCF